jgi:hypothetical protein
MSVGELYRICQENAIEVTFTRRHKKGNLPTRRIFCTTNQALLDSPEGRKFLNYVKPTKTPPYNAGIKGLVTVWDIFKQGWRNIPAAGCGQIVTSYPLKSALDLKRFWQIFDTRYSKMSEAEKTTFMII